MQKFFQKKENSKKGFTLIEMLVAVLIFTFSLLSIVVIMGDGISKTTLSKERITAYYLAQEGLETMRNLRDTRALYDDWATFIVDISTCFSDPNDPNDNACYINPITHAIVSCSSGSCVPITYSAANGYGYNGGDPNSAFTRIIEVKDFSGTDEDIGVFATVHWGDHSVTFSETLMNWINPI